MAEKEVKHQIKQDLCILADRQAIIVNPLAAVPKGETEIHDVSRPESDAINGLTGHHTERYQTVEEAGWLAKPGYFPAKVDLLSAYHSVPIHPDCYKTTGLAWQFDRDCSETFFFDAHLPFGSKCRPSQLDRISIAIKRMIIRKVYQGSCITLMGCFFLGGVCLRYVSGM